MRVPWARAEPPILPGGVAMLIVRAPHELVTRRLRSAQVVASVGPTSQSGWTCVWLDQDDATEPADWGVEEYLTVEELASGSARVRARDSNGTTAVLWSSEGAAFEPRRAATMLAGMFDAWDHLAGLEVLCATADPYAFESGLEGLLDLPELEPGPSTGVIISDGDPMMVRTAAAVAGPGYITPVGQGWLAIAPTPIAASGPAPVAGDAEDLAVAISAVVRRRDHTLVLRREAGRAGVEIWGRGGVLAGWSWGGWELVDPGWAESVFCELCASINPEIHIPTLRALLRRWTSDDPLAELIGLLGLPEVILRHVDATAAGQTLPDSERIERLPPRRAWRAAATSSAATPTLIGHRLFYGAFTAVTVLAAVVSLAMTALGIAVIATDGSVIEQDGHSLEDWAFVGFFALFTVFLTAMLAPTATFRLLRLFARPRGAADHASGDDPTSAPD